MTDVLEFSQHFCGAFQGVRYDYDLPVPPIFCNHDSCKKFLRFIGNTILQRLSEGLVNVQQCHQAIHSMLRLTVLHQSSFLCLSCTSLNSITFIGPLSEARNMIPLQ